VCGRLKELSIWNELRIELCSGELQYDEFSVTFRELRLAGKFEVNTGNALREASMQREMWLLA
jgi:hypothetical protein